MNEEVYITPNAGPKVTELPSTSTEPPIFPEPVKPTEAPDGWMAVELSYVVSGLAVTFTSKGGTPPYTLDFGDGNSKGGLYAGDYQHTYADYGDYTAALTDIHGQTAGATVEEVLEPIEEVPPPETPPEVKEWEGFNRHQQFEDFWQRENLGEHPSDWDIMTVAGKKEWMDENVE